MPFLNLLNDANIILANNGVAAGTSLITSGTVKMDQYDSVLFIADMGAVTSTATMQMVAQDGANSNGTGAANITDQGGNTVQTTSVTDAGGVTTNTYLALDVHRPSKEFVNVLIVRGVANSVLNRLWAITYNGKNKPVTQGATCTQGNTFLAAS